MYYATILACAICAEIKSPKALNCRTAFVIGSCSNSVVSKFNFRLLHCVKRLFIHNDKCYLLILQKVINTYINTSLWTSLQPSFFHVPWRVQQMQITGAPLHLENLSPQLHLAQPYSVKNSLQWNKKILTNNGGGSKNRRNYIIESVTTKSTWYWLLFVKVHWNN